MNRLHVCGALVALLLCAAVPRSNAGAAKAGISTLASDDDIASISQLRVERVQVIGGGPSGLMMFILAFQRLAKLVDEGVVRAGYATVTLYEKRDATVEHWRARTGTPDYKRSQILRLDTHALQLLKSLARDGTTAYDNLFTRRGAIGHCLREVRQPDVTVAGYDHVMFGQEAGFFDSEEEFCHIQTKYLERELYAHAVHLVRQTTVVTKSRYTGTHSHRVGKVIPELHYGYEWVKYDYDAKDGQYYSEIRSRYEAYGVQYVPFDALLSAQGACLRCENSVRKQLLGEHLLGKDEATPGSVPGRASFKGTWKPADDTYLSWGMTGFFEPYIAFTEDTWRDVKVYLRTLASAEIIRRFGGPILVRSFWNTDLHYIGLGLSPATVAKFALQEGRKQIDDFWWEVIPYILQAARKERLGPQADVDRKYIHNIYGWYKDDGKGPYAPSVFPIELFSSEDNIRVLAPPKGSTEGSRSALVSFQGDEARLPNFVTFSGINWGFYGVDRGSTNLKTGCHGMYNLLKTLARSIHSKDYGGGAKCIHAANEDSKALSVSLAAKAKALANLVKSRLQKDAVLSMAKGWMQSYHGDLPTLQSYALSDPQVMREVQSLKVQETSVSKIIAHLRGQYIPGEAGELRKKAEAFWARQKSIDLGAVYNKAYSDMVISYRCTDYLNYLDDSVGAYPLLTCLRDVAKTPMESGGKAWPFDKCLRQGFKLVAKDVAGPGIRDECALIFRRSISDSVIRINRMTEWPHGLTKDEISTLIESRPTWWCNGKASSLFRQLGTALEEWWAGRKDNALQGLETTLPAPSKELILSGPRDVRSWSSRFRTTASGPHYIARRDGLLLGCGELSYVTCASSRQAAAAAPMGSRVLPAWATEALCPGAEPSHAALCTPLADGLFSRYAVITEPAAAN